MGEYYRWVNVDKKEYLCPNDFDYGSKRWESSGRGNEVLCALREMISREWSGDHIFWMGDEKLIPDASNNDTLQLLYAQTVEEECPGDGFDTVCETYRDISCLFKTAETVVREEIGFYLESVRKNEFHERNEYGINIERPFEGLFLRKGRDFRYTINHTKRVYYTFEETKMIGDTGYIYDDIDPLLSLMAFGRIIETGDWVGDIIGVSDEKPEEYELLEEIHFTV